MNSQNQITQEKAVEIFVKNNKNKTAAANELGIPRTNLRRLLKRAAKNPQYKKVFENQFQETQKSDTNILLRSQLQDLKQEINRLTKKAISAEEIKKYIYEIKDLKPEIPDWVSDVKKSSSGVIGVPSVAFSDFHWGEVVSDKQIMGANKYNLEIARQRLERTVDSIIDLSFNHIANPNYPGIVVNLLGDMIMGRIHDELILTAEKELLEIHLDLYGAMIAAISKLADAFGKVFVPCVPGNHGRLTQKPRAKGYVYDSLDWSLYCLLQKWFESDNRIKFLVSDGEDAQYKIYNTIYRITHGSQFRGGDSIIGPIGPVIRGDVKKRAQARDMSHEYDVLVIGHFHQHMTLQRLIINGSLVGFNEYAWKGVFPYEKPTQGFWITHPEYGKTFDLPIFAESRGNKGLSKDWVSWQE